MASFNPGGAASLNEATKLRLEANPDTNTVTDAEKASIPTAVQPGGDALETVQARTVSADTTLVEDDRGRFVDATDTATITIPTNASVAFALGSVITVQRLGVGAVTITGAAGVTVNGVAAGSGTVGAQWQGVSLRKIGADEWVASGDIEVG